MEWLGTLFTTADDLFKAVITFLGLIFSGGKAYDVWLKYKEGNNKVKEAEINANKEIQNNRDKHNAEVERLKDTINHQASEIKYKDGLVIKHEETIREYKRKNEELIRINEAKDKERNEMYERLLECEKGKK